MSAHTAKRKNDNVVIVDNCEFMRKILKNMILGHGIQILEAGDVVGALSLAVKHNPRVAFVSMEGNENWPNLVTTFKNRWECKVVAYSTGITREAVARAFFAGVDEILVSPQNQKERIEKCLLINAGFIIDK